MSGPNTLECGGRLIAVGGQATIGNLELRPSGARQTPRNEIKTIAEREETMSMRHAAAKRTNAVTRRPLKRSSEIILAAIIYLTASCFAVVGTLGFVAAIWVMWGTLGVR